MKYELINSICFIVVSVMIFLARKEGDADGVIYNGIFLIAISINAGLREIKNQIKALNAKR